MFLNLKKNILNNEKLSVLPDICGDREVNRQGQGIWITEGVLYDKHSE